MWQALLLTGALVALAACSDDGDVAAGTAQTALTITVDLGNGSAAQEWALTCDPPGGTHPQPEAACAALGAVDPTVFGPVGPGQACTQIYGGPETATIRGTWNGQPVDASFARNDGCEIARWDAVGEILGAGTATAAPT
jgi:Subtilisin inhibitor-like